MVFFLLLVVQKNLEVGEVLAVDVSCIVALTASIDVQIKFNGPMRRAVFGVSGFELVFLYSRDMMVVEWGWWCMHVFFFFLLKFVYVCVFNCILAKKFVLVDCSFYLQELLIKYGSSFMIDEMVWSQLHCFVGLCLMPMAAYHLPMAL